MSADLTPQMFEEATLSVVSNTQAYRDAGNAHARVKMNLETSKAHALREGVEGKNDKEREANMGETLSAEYAEEHASSLEVNDARAALEVAQAELKCLSYKLRLLEATA